LTLLRALILTLAAALGAAGAPAGGDRITPELRARMARGGDAPIPISIRMAEQFDASAFLETWRERPKQERRRALIEEASAFAAAHQEELREQLERARRAGDAERVRHLWIVNLVTARLRSRWIEEIAALPGVERVGFDPRPSAEAIEDAAPPPGPASGPGPGPLAEDDVGWGVRLIGGPRVWDLGFEGQGVVIANIDSGTDHTHPDLAGHIWNNPHEIPDNGTDDELNGFVDDVLGWDFDHDDATPEDSTGHGTKTAGVACGDGTQGLRTGVAPKAELMILKVRRETDHMAAQQYAIENGADLITSSVSYKWYFDPRPDYHSFRDASQMLLAAGLIHANSPSNDSNDVGVPWNIAAPALCPPPWLHPEQSWKGGLGATVAVGGQKPSGWRYNPTPFGPATWEDITLYDPLYPHAQDSLHWDYPFGGDSLGLIKVDLLCPTTLIPSTIVGGGYTETFSGTSAATPHFGGALALLLSADPSLTPGRLHKAILSNTIDLGPPGLDHKYGAGQVDVHDAVLDVLTKLSLDRYAAAPGDTVYAVLQGPADAPYEVMISDHLLKAWYRGTVVEVGYPPYPRTNPGVLNAAGSDTLMLVVPDDPDLSRNMFYVQSITDDTGGLTGRNLASLYQLLMVE